MEIDGNPLSQIANYADNPFFLVKIEWQKSVFLFLFLCLRKNGFKLQARNCFPRRCTFDLQQTVRLPLLRAQNAGGADVDDGQHGKLYTSLMGWKKDFCFPAMFSAFLFSPFSSKCV